MALREILNQIDGLQNKIESHGRLDKDVLNKIQYRFRLDWNYHSNAMEGNSLTQSETRSVMINNITIEGKPLRDVLEIRGHDTVITDILRIGKGELRLSEKRIKDIHKAIIHEDNPKLAQKVGHWKTEPNYLINYKNEKYEFVLPDEVPEQMHTLINWLNAQRDLILTGKETALHPVLLAFHFHLRYVGIHPFYDGNGRTARIFTNLILISFGYPPVIIEVGKKNIYNQYLADIQAYGGSPDLYLEFMCKQLTHSQEVVLIAIEGGDIEHPDDIDKKILLLEKELNAVDPNNTIADRLNGDVFLKMFDSWISELLLRVIPMVQKFNRFFIGTQHSMYIHSGNSSFGSLQFSSEEAESIIEKFKAEIIANKKTVSPNHLNMYFSTFYGTFIKAGINTFGCNYGFDIECDFTKYRVVVDEFAGGEPDERKKFVFNERLLHQPLSSAEIDKLVKILGDAIYQHIDFNTKKSGIR
jgi:Fic family protein